jgi:hypothetical protein
VLPSGELEVDTAQGAVRFSRPKAFQNIAGRQVPVQVAYQSDGLSYGFHLGDYDPAHEVVVDPAVSWATYLGGSFEDHAYAVTMGENGYVYVAGGTRSSDFQPTLKRSHSGNNDAFLVKVKPDGTDLVFATLVGGSGDEEANSVAVDERGVALITGGTSSTDLPQINALQSYGGGGDAFIVRFNASGSDLVISTFVGGSSTDEGHGITVDDDKNFYVVGETNSTDFPTTTGPTHDSDTDSEVFIIKVSSGGSQFWARLMGGDSNDIGYAIAVDEDKNTYIAGQTSGGFPTTNAFQDTIGGYDPANPDDPTNDDAFVAKLNSDVSSVLYSSYLGGSEFEGCYGLYVKDQVAYLVGATESDSDFNPAGTPPIQSTHGGYSDMFIAMVTHTTGNPAMLAYSTYLGGTGEDIGWGITLDHEGNIYVVGDTTGDFPTGDPFQASYAGNYDAVMAMIAPAGSSVVYASYLGGSQWDSALGVAVDSDGIVYIVGETKSTDFPDATSGDIQSTHGGSDYNDAFIAAIDSGEASPEPVEETPVQNLQPCLLPILRTE